MSLLKRLIPVFLCCLLGWGLYQTPSLTIDSTLPVSTQVVDQQGKILRIFTTTTGYWRLPAQLDDISPELIRALIQYEDKRFYQHHGVDGLSIIRAVGQLLVSGRIVSGASTLTMQTVRLMQPKPRTFWNKGREMIQAIKFELRYSKQEILQHYLTLAPYGGNIQGIEAASLFYFGHSAKRLVPSEIALLISLPQSPEVRRPDVYPVRSKEARNRVIRRLLMAGILTEEAASLAQQQQIPKQRIKTPFLAPHLSQRLKQQNQRPIIRTTLDRSLQKRLTDFALSSQQTLPEGTTLALMVVDYQTLEVKAHIGSGDFFSAGQIDLTRAIRSPGSSLKPFIYGLGFEKNLFHPHTKVDDHRYRLNRYRPENFDRQYAGVMNLSEALGTSRNIPAVLALERLGIAPFLLRFEQLGIPLILPDQQAAGLAIALGGVGTRLEDLVSLYSAIANQGQWSRLRVLSRTAQSPRHRLMSSKAANFLDQILQKIPPPTGFVRHHPIRYKTGTSYGYRDAWSIGYDGRYTVGVWVGQVDGGFGRNQTGLNTAAPLLFQAFELLPPKTKVTHITPLDLVPFEDLPAHLQWLGRHPVLQGEQPEIVFPVDDSRLILKSGQKTVRLSAKGGVPPFHWLVNQQLIQGMGYQHHALWQPDGQGRHRIRVIDAEGQSDEVSIWIQ